MNASLLFGQLKNQLFLDYEEKQHLNCQIDRPAQRFFLIYSNFAWFQYHFLEKCRQYVASELPEATIFFNFSLLYLDFARFLMGPYT